MYHILVFDAKNGNFFYTSFFWFISLNVVLFYIAYNKINMSKKVKEAIKYSEKWLNIIQQVELPEKKKAKWIIDESINNFSNHFNKGWLKYKKSITESDGYAAVEWNGEGAIFQDVLWRKYIDFLGGYGLMSHGWSNPDVINAVRAQLLSNAMPSQELIDPLRGALAKILADILPWDLQYSFFVASGTEAVEWAIKLAKMYTKKSAFISTVNGFHGKTMGALSMMGKASYRTPVWQLYGGQVYHVPFWDAAAMEKQLEICEKLGVGVAWVIIEPIQWEAGAIVPPDDYWPKVRAMTKKYNTLLIADEVQTGLGRTGKLWWVDNWWIVPDIMTLWKALWGGVMPLAAFCSTEEIWQCMMEPNPFIHTTTTGWNPLACAAWIAAIHVALKDDFANMALEKWEYMMRKIKEFMVLYPWIYKEITWKWLLIGQHFVNSKIGYKVSAGLFRRGVLVAGTLISPNTIRIEPPIVITYEEIDEGLSRLEDTLKEVHKKLQKKK